MKKNIWYLIAGIFNMVGAISSFITGAIMLLMGTDFWQLMMDYDYYMTEEELAVMEGMGAFLDILYYFMIVIIAAGILVAVLSSIKFFKFSNTNEKSPAVILWIVLTFIFCGVLSGILGIVGYVTCDENTSVNTNTQPRINEQPIQYSQTSTQQSYSNINQLKDLQKLREQNVISESEYEQMRLRILEQSNKDNNNF